MSGPVDEGLNGDANLVRKGSGLCSEEVCVRAFLLVERSQKKMGG